MPSTQAFTLERFGDRWDADIELAGSTGATIRYQKGPDRGILTVTVRVPGSGVNPYTPPVTTAIDCYALSPSEATTSITTNTTPSAAPQPRLFLFEVTGNNASSTGRRCVVRGVDY